MDVRSGRGGSINEITYAYRFSGIANRIIFALQQPQSAVFYAQPLKHNFRPHFPDKPLLLPGRRRRRCWRKPRRQQYEFNKETEIRPSPPPTFRKPIRILKFPH